MNIPQDQAAIVARYEDDMVTGKCFDRMAASQSSRFGYMPPPSRGEVASLYRAAADLAAKGDQYVPFAMAIAQSGGQYANTAELLARAYQAIALVVKGGYTDVLRLASPEPCRRSDAHRCYTIREVLTVSAAMRKALDTCNTGSLPGPGWVEALLIEREGGLR